MKPAYLSLLQLINKSYFSNCLFVQPCSPSETFLDLVYFNEPSAVELLHSYKLVSQDCNIKG